MEFDINSLMLWLGEMKGDVKAILANQQSTNQRVDKVETRIDGLDSRVKDTEMYRAKILGACIVISAIVAAIMPFFLNR
jgi:hypothetical protein